jgi:hypothetical protein
MQPVPEQFRLNLQPAAAREAVVRLGNARFTVLTDRLIRLEYDPGARFEDRASQTFWFREQPVPAFTYDVTECGVDIETEFLRLRYDARTGGGFTPENLSILVKSTGAEWHAGDADDYNLKGTTRTLDMCNGYTPLGSGLVSRAGWAVVDDSTSLVFNQDDWLEPRSGSQTDWYFFGYGHDYKVCLHDYCRISGSIPMIPRWMLGNWWSRYWAYTQDELTQLILDFEARQIPLSVCIIDMDWHLTNTGNSSSGWTGYTWNRDLFPEPKALIDFMHEKGLRTALNLHPAEGIHPHEEHYPEMARRLGIDPETRQPVPFDITDPEFAKAYFEVLHHPYEAMGIDFWWIDWQQGLKCRIGGLDPLWLINHLHFFDLGRDGSRRPFIFSRWGDKGHQRYPIGFSGDSYATWDSLRFQPYMTSTASNIAYGWWSHDIGGHISGVGDSELFTRWVQFGILSPIMRIHSTKGFFYDYRPWMFEDADVTNVIRDAMQLRHAFIPYLYTMARRAHDESLPLILPMYYEYPEQEAAYVCPQQYLFGTELIAAPFTEPADPDTGLSRQVIWLPEGDWYHFFTGEHFTGDAWYPLYGKLKDIPLFARAGAIVPLGPKVGWDGIGNPDELHVHLFAGADNTFTLYEDDGETNDYLDARACRTTLTQHWHDNLLEFWMSPAADDSSLVPKTRTIHLYIHGVKAGGEIAVWVDGATVPIDASYDVDTETLKLDGVHVPASSGMRITVKIEGETLLSRRSRKRETLLDMLKFFRLHIGVRNRIADELDQIMARPAAVAPYLITMSESQSRALFETLYEAGMHHIANAHDPTLLVLWNNRQDEQITYRYNDAYLYFGFVQSAQHENGVLPRLKTIKPNMLTWCHGALGENVQRTQWHVQIDYHNLGTTVENYREQTP